jgi:hypothetical protein
MALISSQLIYNEAKELQRHLLASKWMPCKGGRFYLLNCKLLQDGVMIRVSNGTHPWHRKDFLFRLTSLNRVAKQTMCLACNQRITAGQVTPRYCQFNHLCILGASLTGDSTELGISWRHNYYFCCLRRWWKPPYGSLGITHLNNGKVYIKPVVPKHFRFTAPLVYQDFSTTPKVIT